MERQIILTVGPRGGILEKLEQALNRPQLDVQHVNLASTALDRIASDRPVVVIVAYPPNDLSSDEFFRGLEKSMAALIDTKVVLLADEHHLDQLERHLDRRHLLLSPRWAPHLLQRYVLSLLPTKLERAKRLMLRLEVEMGTERRIRMCQTDNISESGMLVRTNHLPLVGSRVNVAISLPSQTEPVRAEAEIVRHTDPDRERIRGLGLRFLEIEGEGLEALRRYLQQWDASLSATI